MGAHSRISRRAFLARAAGAAAGAGLGLGLAARELRGASSHSQSQADEQPGGRMSHRRLGRTGVMISIIAGGGMPEALFPRAIEAGINYWHAVGYWKPPKALTSMPRDSFYCDMVIDHLEEEKAIEQFEAGLAKSGLEMVDFFKIHSRYRTPEEIKEQPGVLRAFEKLKREKKTRWLAVSQHSNIGEVLSACIESGFFDAIQPSYNPALEQEVGAVIDLAKKHDVGVIAMKAMMGGPDQWASGEQWRDSLEPYLRSSRDVAQALIRYALARDGVTAVVPGVRSFEELEQALAAARAPLSTREEAALTALAGAVGGNYCRMCGRCEAACPRGIALADIFRYQMYWRDYGDMERAVGLYAELPAERGAAGCDGCGNCRDACPYGRPVMPLLREAHTMLA